MSAPLTEEELKDLASDPFARPEWYRLIADLRATRAKNFELVSERPPPPILLDRASSDSILANEVQSLRTELARAKDLLREAGPRLARLHEFITFEELEFEPLSVRDTPRLAASINAFLNGGQG